MRKFKPTFLLMMALLTGAAIAADVGVSSRTPLTTGDEVARAATPRTTTTRSTTSRSTQNTANNSSDDAGVTARTTTRSTVSRSTGTTTSSRGTASRATTNQSKATNTTRAATGDINSNPAVRRAGVTLRPSFADYGGRATIAGTGTMTGSNVRNDIQKLSGRAAKNVTATAESLTGTRETLERTAELNKSCQEQYTECMDQFCAVIDANQKRCSCSSNLSRYTKVEKAVTEANNKLNEVAQAIRYVGLSADEIRAIMSETEAEEALRETKDTSATRNMLKQIESMIKDPTSRTNNYVSEMDFGLDMDLTFSSDPVDIFSLDFLNLGTNNSGISNLRGTELYNTAKKRCNTILSRCKEAGATQDQIVGNYDLAIDKDCIDYEAGLKKMNETLLSNVKSANLMLQKARLAVVQNKNQYDAVGCVSALENCMKDDMVCGEDYLQCVDPTKTYIDENGEVVMGQDITVIQSFMSDYNNAMMDNTFLQSAYNTRVDPKTCPSDGKCVVRYLLHKIGTKQKTTEEGLCRAVLDKCQIYTYDKNNKYKPYNDIVVNYLQRAMVSIRAAQQRIISDYASNCITDVAACYSQQVTQVSGLTTSAKREDVKAVMRGACRSIALTCGFAIFTGKPEIDPSKSYYGTNYSVSGCKYLTGPDASDLPEYGKSTYNNAIINCVSDMFYDSLLDSLDSGSSSSSNNNNITTTYTVAYSCGTGSSGQPWTQTNIAANQSITLPADPTTTGKCTKPEGKAFAGWSVNGGAAQKSGNITVTGNINVVAQWGAGSYKITYKCGLDATGADWELTNVPSPITLAQDPTTTGKCTAPTGKKFGGWKVGNSETTQSAGAQNIQITADTILPAVWGNGEYTYSYDCNNNGAGGDAPTAPNNGKVTYGNSITLSANAGSCNPPAAGKKFGNAWLDGNNAEKTGTIQWNYTQNQVFKAKWINENEYRVVYEINVPTDDDSFTGSAMQPSTYTVGVAKALPIHTFEVAGYTFSGWNTDRNGGGQPYSEGADFNMTSSPSDDRVTLYAQWTPNTYNVTYSCGTGSDVGGTVPQGGTATYNSQYQVAPNTCTKVGYDSDLMAWQDTSANLTKTPGSSMKWRTTKDVNFVAVWDGVGSCAPGKYLPAGGTECETCPAGKWCEGVTFTNNSTEQGISGICTDVQYDCSNTKTGAELCEDRTEKTHATGTSQHYTATCRRTTSDPGSTKQGDCKGEAFVSTPVYDTCYVTGCDTNYQVSSDRTSCEPVAVPTYTVSYNCNGANQGYTPNDQTQNVGTPVTLQANTCNYTNHVFTGWNTKPDGSGTPYTAAQSYSDISVDITLYAQWGAQGSPDAQYTVSYLCSAGGTGPGSDSVSAGQKVNLPDNADGCTVPAGKHFTGWYKQGSETTHFDPGDEYTVSGAVTFVTEWTDDGTEPSPDEYCEVQYRCGDGGTVKNGSEIYYERIQKKKGTSISLPEDDPTDLYCNAPADKVWSGLWSVNGGSAQVPGTPVQITSCPDGPIIIVPTWVDLSLEIRINYDCMNDNATPWDGSTLINRENDDKFTLDSGSDICGLYENNIPPQAIFIGWKIDNIIYLPEREYDVPSLWQSDTTRVKRAIGVYSAKKVSEPKCNPENVDSSMSGSPQCYFEGTGTNKTWYFGECNAGYGYDTTVNRCIPTCTNGSSPDSACTSVNTNPTGSDPKCATYYCKCDSSQTATFNDRSGAGTCTGTVNTLTLKYHCSSAADSGSTAPADQTVNVGGTVTLSDNTNCSRSGMVFSGWKGACHSDGDDGFICDGSDSAYIDMCPGATVQLSNNITLNAKYAETNSCADNGDGNQGGGGAGDGGAGGGGSVENGGETGGDDTGDNGENGGGNSGSDPDNPIDEEEDFPDP